MSARADRATAHAADLDEARDARYANPFAPPDETEAAAEPAPRSLFGEILDWMLAPLLLLWPMSIAVTYLVAKSIANGPFDRALETDAYVLARQIPPMNGVAELSLPDATRDFLRADNVDSVFYQVLGTRGELVGGEPTCRCRTRKTGRRRASSNSVTTCCAATISASLIRRSSFRRRPARSRCWCRSPRRSTNAASSPTTSSKA